MLMVLLCSSGLRSSIIFLFLFHPSVLNSSGTNGSEISEDSFVFSKLEYVRGEATSSSCFYI